MNTYLSLERNGEMSQSKSKWELFVELANPDPKTGVSRWVDERTEYVGRYSVLIHKNGWDWGRESSELRRRYMVEVDRTKTPGNSIDRVRLVGYKKDETFNNRIRNDIRKIIKTQKCVMLGVNGESENTRIEVDHKDGRKDDMRVSDMQTQRVEDFQPLCKAANDIKRQICKNCKRTNKRWRATNIAGNPFDFYQGNEDFNPETGCKGCYQYDPVEYRIQSALRLSHETAEFILKKFYPDYKPLEK